MPEKLKKQTPRHRIGSCIVNVAFRMCILFVFWIGLRIFAYSVFRIPSNSMEPALVSGDEVIVCKPVLGARIFNPLTATTGKEVTTYRLPGFRKVRRNDVLVFNFPHLNSWGSIGMNLQTYYVKRCIGIPGDTVEIRNGFYQINGRTDVTGNRQQQKKLSAANENDYPKEVFHTFPYQGTCKWTIKEFGPLPVPGKNIRIPLSPENIYLYKPLIEWESRKSLRLQSDSIYLGDTLIQSYCFEKNYYFMAGDRVENSKDSRYWGLLPEEFIVGKACLIFNPRLKNRFLKVIR